MRNKGLEFQDLISLQKVEISNLLKKKDLLQQQVLEYESERDELVIHAHKSSQEISRLEKEVFNLDFENSSLRTLNSNNGDMAMRCYRAEKKVIYMSAFIVALIVMFSIIIFS